MLERLRERTGLRAIPVIILTAESDTHTVNRALQLGAKQFLVKATFTVRELLEHVRRWSQVDDCPDE